MLGAWSLSKAAAKASKAARMAKVEAAKVVKAAEAAEVAATKATAAVTAAEEAKAAAAAQAKKTAKVAAKAAAAAAAAAQAAEVADAAAAALEVGKMYAALSAVSFFRNLYCTQGRFMRVCVTVHTAVLRFNAVILLRKICLISKKVMFCVRVFSKFDFGAIRICSTSYSLLSQSLVVR